LFKFLSKHRSDIIFIFMLLVCFVTAAEVMLLIMQYSGDLDTEALQRASYYGDNLAASLDERISEAKLKAESVSMMLSDIDDKDEFNKRIGNIESNDNLKDCRDVWYYYDGYIYNTERILLQSQDVTVLNMCKNGVSAVSPLIYDSTNNMRVICAFAPVQHSQYIDGILLLYPAEFVSQIKFDETKELFDKSNLSVLCDNSGDILKILHKGDSSVETHQDIYEVIQDITGEKSGVDQFKKYVAEEESVSYIVNIDGINTAISISGGDADSGGFFIVSFYNLQEIYYGGYDFFNTALGLIVLILILLIVFSIYFAISRGKINKRIFEIGAIDPVLGCPTPVGFQRDVDDILRRNKATNFGVIVAHVNHFNYLLEKFGEAGADGILKNLSYIYKKALQTDEAYCYNSDGDFALLLHYRDKKVLQERLTTVLSAIHLFSSTLSKIFDINIVFGIYEIQRDNPIAVQKMIDFALVAKSSTSNNDVDNIFRYYSDDLRTNVMMRAEIEARMDNALKNEEFKLFYQPKYNIAKDTLDGCEILVRWYDPFKQEYRVPGEFLPVFEQNGFIIKLDHYVYIKACETLANEIQSGEQTYFVSVNVSRLTAIQEDFVDFYISQKKKYGIRDGLIIIEFTESFAYENYDYLIQIIDKLHKNGFKCSVDDFGTGYSSFNILKELKMDEIKLDRFFLLNGISPNRDQLILAGVVGIIKALGMTVTQEGAETIEDFDRLRKLGCDIIQGYYYSKPLTYKDYRRFASERGSSVNPTLFAD